MSDINKNKNKINISLFKFLKRPITYIGLILALILFVFQQTIRVYVSDSIGSVLVSSMKEASGGAYKITYDLVRFDIITRELKISNLKIELDTANISKEEYLKKRLNLIHINTPIIIVKLRSLLLQLLFKDELSIRYIVAQNPKFQLIRSLHHSVEKNTDKNSIEYFKKKLNDSFTIFEIDSFRIKKGSFKIIEHSEEEKELTSIDIGEFSMLLKSFKLDSLSPSLLLNGISTQSVDLEIINQSLNLSNLNQNIYFKRLSLSTGDAKFMIDSLSIKNIAQGKASNKSELSISKLEILGHNFKKMYLNNELTINEIIITNPRILFKKSTKKTPPHPLAFFHYFHQLKISKISVLNGYIDYKADRKSEIENFTLVLSDYEINTQDWKKKKFISTFKIQSLQANTIKHELADSIHSINIDQFDYSKLNNRGLAKGVYIKALSGKGTYRSLKSKMKNISIYSRTKSIVFTNFFPEKLVLTNELNLDSVIIEEPRFMIYKYDNLESNYNFSFQEDKLKFSVNHLITNNGSLKLRNYKNRVWQSSLLNGVYFKTSKLNEFIKKKKIAFDYSLNIINGTTELKTLGQNLSFTNLKLDTSRQIIIDQILIKPDSINFPTYYVDAKLSNIIVKNINIESLKNDSLIIDTLLIESLNLINNISPTPSMGSSNRSKKPIHNVVIGNLGVKHSTLGLKKEDLTLAINDGNIAANDIQVDLSQHVPLNIKFNNTQLNFNNLNFENKKKNIQIKTQKGYYSELDSVIIVDNIRFSSIPKNLNLQLSQIKIIGFDKRKLKNNKHLEIRLLQILEPNFMIKSIKFEPLNIQPLDSNQLLLSGNLNKIKIDSLSIIDGKSSIILSNNRLIEAKSIQGIITNFSVDTLTQLKSILNKVKGSFELKDIYLKGLNETLSVMNLQIDAERKNIFTDSIYYSAKTKKNIFELSSPGFIANYTSLPKLFEKKLDINYISSKNNRINITQIEALENTNKKLPIYITPLNLGINKISFINTSFRYKPLNKSNHIFSSLTFDTEIDNLLVPKNAIFNIAKHTKDSQFKAYNFTFNLPDSLNTLDFDTLLASSKNSNIRISNLRLKPRYKKNEYANQVGYQADWKNLLIEHTEIEEIDFVELLEKKALECKKITFKEGYLDIFKDQQLPFQKDRIVPIFQDRIKNIPIPVKVDSIRIMDINIFLTILESTGLKEGKISFINTGGLITNITNDKSKLSKNNILKITAHTTLLGLEKLRTNFTFDMTDKNNRFLFDANLGAIDAAAFNSILEATTFIRIQSGAIKSIQLQAEANKNYAYGNMLFIYNNLKIKAINERALEQAGTSKLLKTFFANTFVVKKNNFKSKILANRGEMYFERDRSRITIDYAVKTALSGIISSIGAKSNRKGINQMRKNEKKLYLQQKE